MRNLINNTLNKRGRLLAVVMGFIMLFSSVSNGAEAATKKLKVTSPKTVTVKGTIKIKTNMKCKFKSSNKKIATVSSKGVVKGKKAGKVKITVTAKKTKQKKTVTITVKKQAKKVVTKTPSTSEPETTPTVIATQPPQGGVTQIPPIPVQSEGAKQTPSVPVTPPATRKPSETLKPATPVPTITAKPPTRPPETSDVQQTKAPIGTKTPKPSLTPAPTSTATPSPTTPSQTKQPIGITAEFEGKLPLNNTTSNQDVTLGFVNEYTVITIVKYSDGMEKRLKFNEFTVGEGKVVEDNGKRYAVKEITYEGFSTTLRVEIVEVDAEVLYPDSIMCTYQGGTIKEGEYPDLKDIKTEAIYDYNTLKIVEPDQLNVNLLYGSTEIKRYRFEINYNYYFEFNGEKLHSCAMDSIYVSYE